MIWYWSFYDVSQVTLNKWLGLSTDHTLPNWFNMMRDLCQYWVRDNPIRIGGPGHIVQIDESLISTPKR